MQPDLMTMAAQFGTAGLIAWMWLTERRQSQKRDGELSEAHEALRRQSVTVDSLVRVVEDNTRALTTLEGSQRRLGELLERWEARRSDAHQEPQGPQEKSSAARSKASTTPSSL